MTPERFVDFLDLKPEEQSALHATFTLHLLFVYSVWIVALYKRRSAMAALSNECIIELLFNYLEETHIKAVLSRGHGRIGDTKHRHDLRCGSVFSLDNKSTLGNEGLWTEATVALSSCCI